MVNEYIINLLRKKISENLFFIRIFNFNNSTYIWNDPQIYIKLNEYFINMKNIDIFVKMTIKILLKKICKYEFISSFCYYSEL
jgi:hypothetical protein